MTKIWIKIGEIIFCFRSERQLEIEPELLDFCVDAEEHPDVLIDIRWDYEQVRKPVSPMMGENLLQKFYIEDDVRFCETKGGWKGPVGQVIYSEDCRYLKCSVNHKPFFHLSQSLGWVIRLLPLREIYQCFDVLFFHAAQIAVSEGGILFTAPSGTGKSTQAALWQQYEDAKILCGDRTLVRKSDSIWHCFGYPIDGSSPIRSTEKTPLKAIVLLAQAKENKVERLQGARAAAMLMPQLVIDEWSHTVRSKAIEMLLGIQEDIKIYRLLCTPDVRAVKELKQRFIEDGIMEMEG